MFALHGRTRLHFDADPFVARVTANPNRPVVVRGNEVLIDRSTATRSPSGFKCVFVTAPGTNSDALSAEQPVLDLPPELSHLEEGDVVRCDPRQGEILVTYKRRTNSNALILTENCDNGCIMCCQPPKAIRDDGLISIALETIRLMDRSTRQIAISGGEPTLKWHALLSVIRMAKGYLQNTALQVLSNGRAFKYLHYAQELASLRHCRLIVGVPIHSALPEMHNFIAQRSQAFDDTILGIMNLKRCGTAVQLRIVIQKANADTLVELGQFISRNLAFADHIAFMGMEVHGLALDNLATVWIDPVDYAEELRRAVRLLTAHHMNVSIFNVPLCVLAPDLWRFCEQSISEWKLEYAAEECNSCEERWHCGGLFGTSGSVQSRGIHRLTKLAF
jgi:His-Xaa-Ser system radical SAM maturase HxsC